MGLGASLMKDQAPPFEGKTLVEERILPQFLPAEPPPGKVQTFLFVVAEKIAA